MTSQRITPKLAATADRSAEQPQRAIEGCEREKPRTPRPSNRRGRSRLSRRGLPARPQSDDTARDRRPVPMVRRPREGRRLGETPHVVHFQLNVDEAAIIAARRAHVVDACHRRLEVVEEGGAIERRHRAGIKRRAAQGVERRHRAVYINRRAPVEREGHLFFVLVLSEEPAAAPPAAQQRTTSTTPGSRIFGQ